MRLLADENLPREAVEWLRAAGHDVRWVAESFPSVRDDDVLAVASHEARVVLTLDKDFGELVFRRGLPATAGVVLLRGASRPTNVLALVRRVFASGADFHGSFVVAGEDRIRVRPLPPPARGDG